jgi:hypothetical protein
MWIAFRFDEGDFLLPSPGQGGSSAGTKSSIISEESGSCLTPESGEVVQMLEPAGELQK